MALAECATHAVFDAVAGPYSTGENTLAGELIDRLEPGMLLLADRGFCGFPLWHKAVATGADLLWRAKPNMKPRPLEALEDGSWLAELRPGGNAGRTTEPLTIRVIDYELDDGRANDTTYRLFTTLLDPVEAPAVDLAVAYAQRWEIESTFDELKTHQRGRVPCCARSHPTSCCKRSGATCVVTSRSGPSCGKPPTTPTSTRTGSASSPLCASLAAPSQRRATFPPQGSDHGWRHVIMLLCRRLNPARRQRSNPRLVKRKYVKWHVKRAHHRDWPQPTGPPIVTITRSN